MLGQILLIAAILKTHHSHNVLQPILPPKSVSALIYTYGNQFYTCGTPPPPPTNPFPVSFVTITADGGNALLTSIESWKQGGFADRVAEKIVFVQFITHDVCALVQKGFAVYGNVENVGIAAAQAFLFHIATQPYILQAEEDFLYVGDRSDADWMLEHSLRALKSGMAAVLPGLVDRVASRDDCKGRVKATTCQRPDDSRNAHYVLRNCKPNYIQSMTKVFSSCLANATRGDHEFLCVPTQYMTWSNFPFIMNSKLLRELVVRYTHCKMHDPWCLYWGLEKQHSLERAYRKSCSRYPNIGVWAYGFFLHDRAPEPTDPPLETPLCGDRQSRHPAGVCLKPWEFHPSVKERKIISLIAETWGQTIPIRQMPLSARSRPGTPSATTVRTLSDLTTEVIRVGKEFGIRIPVTAFFTTSSLNERAMRNTCTLTSCPILERPAVDSWCPGGRGYFESVQSDRVFRPEFGGRYGIAQDVWSDFLKGKEGRARTIEEMSQKSFRRNALNASRGVKDLQEWATKGIKEFSKEWGIYPSVLSIPFGVGNLALQGALKAGIPFIVSASVSKVRRWNTWRRSHLRLNENRFLQGVTLESCASEKYCIIDVQSLSLLNKEGVNAEVRSILTRYNGSLLVTVSELMQLRTLGVSVEAWDGGWITLRNLRSTEHVFVLRRDQLFSSGVRMKCCSDSGSTQAHGATFEVGLKPLEKVEICYCS